MLNTIMVPVPRRFPMIMNTDDQRIPEITIYKQELF